MNKDLYNHVNFCIMREAADWTADGYTSLVNLTGFESAVVAAAVGALTGVDGSNYLTMTLQESNTTVDGDFTAVAAADMISDFTVINAASEDSVIQKVGYLGNKKYLRVKLDETGTISAGIIGVYAILGNARHQVASDVTAVAST